MQQYSPAKLTQAAAAGRRARRRRVPRDRMGRGARDRDRAGWRRSAPTDPKKLAFFTGRDQSQSLTGLWATQFGTPNYAAHGGFCSVNMAAGRHVHDRRQLLGVRRARLGAHQAVRDVRRRRGPRFATRSRSALRQAARRAAPSSSRSTRCAPAIRRSPTNGSASGPAPTGCSCWRWCTSCCAPTRSISTISAATPTPPGW